MYWGKGSYIKNVFHQAPPRVVMTMNGSTVYNEEGPWKICLHSLHAFVTVCTVITSWGISCGSFMTLYFLRSCCNETSRLFLLSCAHFIVILVARRKPAKPTDGLVEVQF